MEAIVVGAVIVFILLTHSCVPEGCFPFFYFHFHFVFSGFGFGWSS